jgi:hypothetical protein
MRVHPTGLLVLLGVVALFALALDVRLGVAAIVAAGVIDWAYLGAPFISSGRQSNRTAR